MRIRRPRHSSLHTPARSTPPPPAPRSGILCPLCGGGTRVIKTSNYVTWLKRVRICVACSHPFPTKEIAMGGDDRRNLFS